MVADIGTKRHFRKSLDNYIIDISKYIRTDGASFLFVSYELEIEDLFISRTRIRSLFSLFSIEIRGLERIDQHEFRPGQ